MTLQALYRVGLAEEHQVPIILPEQPTPPLNQGESLPLNQGESPPLDQVASCIEEGEDSNAVVTDFLLNEYGIEPVPLDLDDNEPVGSSFVEKEAATPLYTGCKTNRLAFILMWQKICARHSLTHLAQDDILGLFGRHVLDPKLDPKMPLTRAEARKVITDVGLDYVTYDACPCDGTLYFDENEKKTSCPIPSCKLSRYREDLVSKKVPRKV